MPKLSGKCLCGAVSFSGDADVKMVMNCHCDDCRAATGSVYGTNVFIAEADVAVTGELKVYTHKSDSGTDMEKHFCPNCGSLMFGKNSGRPGMLTVRAGVIDQKDLVKPAANVFMDSRVLSTPIDANLKGFPRMPG